MKYLIHKGYQGWGDRLQSLSYCIDFAKKTGRLLFIDWSDPLWSQGDIAYGFDQYLGLRDIPRLASIKDIPEDASVYPIYWTGKLDEKPGIWVHSKRTALEIMLTNDRPEDVVVYTAIGYRKWSADTIISHLILKEALITEIQRKLASIPGSDFYAVHLRGNDRPSNIRQCQNIGKQVNDLRLTNPLPVILVSDDHTLVTEWMKIVPDTILITEATHKILTGGVGTHMVPPEKLDKFHLTKGQLNLELLSDFFVYAMGKIYFTNNQASTFSSMAKLLGTFDMSRTILLELFARKG